MVLVNKNGGRRVAGFTFNGWGAKFPPYADDAQLKARLAKHFEMPMVPIDLVLEGGAVAVDGDSTCLTTEQCLLNANRNKKGESRSHRKETKRLTWHQESNLAGQGIGAGSRNRRTH